MRATRSASPCGSPGSERARETARALPGVAVVGMRGSGDDADVVVLAVPAVAARDALDAVRPPEGLVVADATNAVGVPRPDNAVGAEHFARRPDTSPPPMLPLAGDDRGRRLVAGLDLGFEPLDLGGPEAFRLVEDLAQV
jgi:predicted dinucleotide-binding enzyme